MREVSRAPASGTIANDAASMHLERRGRGWNAARDGRITKQMKIEVWRAPVAARAAADDFGAIVRSERVPALVESVTAHGGIVLAATSHDELRGYAALVPSTALRDERWENLPDLFELGSMEVARSCRGRGIGTELLAAIGAELPLESLLVFARGLISHWDLGVDGHAVGRRRQLLHMLGKIGFSRWDTTDPEVTDHPLNFLAVRAGRDAPSPSLLAFAEIAYS